MASFGSVDIDRLDWGLFQNGWVVMYWRKQLLETDAKWLAHHTYKLYRFDCERWFSDQTALVDIGATLGFSEYYGRNLAAFNDCLGDLEIPTDGGAAIVLLRYDHFAKHSPVTAQAILDIFAVNSRSFMLFGRRFITLVQSDDPRLTFDAVGATSVMWNPSEWLNESRGV